MVNFDKLRIDFNINFNSQHRYVPHIKFQYGK